MGRKSEKKKAFWHNLGEEPLIWEFTSVLYAQALQ